VFAQFNSSRVVVSSVAGCRVEYWSPPPGTSDQAGTLTVSGTQAGALTLNSNVNATQQEYQWNDQACQFWNAGDMISVSATGSAVPAFSAMLPAPGGGALTAPACSGNSCGTIDRSQDYAIAWTGNSPALAVLVAGSTSGVAVQCEWTTSPGIIPAAALALLCTSGPDCSASLAVYSVSTQKIDVGEYGILLRAVAALTNGAGSVVTN
jgi:hypothetical protein